MIKRILALFGVLVLAAGLAACGTVKCRNEDFFLELPGDFADRSLESYAGGMDFLYDDGTVAVSGIRETKEAVASAFGEVTAEKYALLLTQLHGLDSQVTQRDGLWCFTYTAVSQDTELTYLCAVHEGTESFWQVQAYCESAVFSDQEARMWEIISGAQVQ